MTKDRDAKVGKTSGIVRISLLSGLVVSLSLLGHQLYGSYIKANTGYGDNWESLAILDGKHPDSLSGGDLSHFKFGNISFEQEPYNLNWKLAALFDEGDGVFERPFSPAKPINEFHYSDGLGPLFNAASCESCHMADGRAPAPSEENDYMGFLLRVSVPGKGPHGGPNPHPVYGGQLSDRAIDGFQPEIDVTVSYTEIPGEYADGTSYSLRKPTYHLTQTNYGPLGVDAMISPRIAPAMIGMGLLDAIHPEDIEAIADPDDQDEDGISGKVNRVWDVEGNRMEVGKYGWKAETPTLRQQIADAAVNDIGISSALFPEQNSTVAQADSRNAVHGNIGDPYEMMERELHQLEVYLEFLAVPARDPIDHPKAVRGYDLFTSLNCTACHKETWVTGDKHRQWRLRKQTIHPYTDLLLHDMGEGLADNRPSYDASGTEWRTPPLWGIGMTEGVNGHTDFLHDGRARNLEEAILWHGGEAESSKEEFRQLNQVDRDALIAFLRTL